MTDNIKDVSKKCGSIKNDIYVDVCIAYVLIIIVCSYVVRWYLTDDTISPRALLLLSLSFVVFLSSLYFKLNLLTAADALRFWILNFREAQAIHIYSQHITSNQYSDLICTLSTFQYSAASLQNIHGLNA